MKQQELIELVQQHHPAMGYKEIRSGLNRAQNDYSARTELIKKTYVQTSTIGRRYYAIHDDILSIMKVQINDVDIPRLLSPPAIDDDEFDGGTGLDTPAITSEERYWYEDNKRIGIVEKLNQTITRDGKTTNFQSISEEKEIRIHAISRAVDFSSSLTVESELPEQFHEALACKVISDAYLIPPLVDKDLHKTFYLKYMEYVRAGRKFAKSRYVTTGQIKPTDF